jgi:hypothetical protein
MMVTHNADAAMVRAGVGDGRAQNGQGEGGEDDGFHDYSLFDESGERLSI